MVGLSTPTTQQCVVHLHKSFNMALWLIHTYQWWWVSTLQFYSFFIGIPNMWWSICNTEHSGVPCRKNGACPICGTLLVFLDTNEWSIQTQHIRDPEIICHRTNANDDPTCCLPVKKRKFGPILLTLHSI